MLNLGVLTPTGVARWCLGVAKSFWSNIHLFIYHSFIYFIFIKLSVASYQTLEGRRAVGLKQAFYCSKPVTVAVGRSDVWWGSWLVRHWLHQNQINKYMNRVDYSPFDSKGWLNSWLNVYIRIEETIKRKYSWAEGRIHGGERGRGSQHKVGSSGSNHRSSSRHGGSAGPKSCKQNQTLDTWNATSLCVTVRRAEEICRDCGQWSHRLFFC